MTAFGVRINTDTGNTLDVGCIQHQDGSLTCSGPVSSSHIKHQFSCSASGPDEYSCTSPSYREQFTCLAVDGINHQTNLKCRKGKGLRSYQTTPANAPTILSPTSVGNTQVNVAWTSPNVQGANTLTGYTVSRNGTSIATPSATTNSFLDTGLTNGTPYTYIVTANYADGTTGQSNSVTVTPFAAPVLTVTKDSLDQANLSWTAPTGVTGLTYNVYRDGALTPINKTPITTTTYKDATILSKGTHTYTVAANLAATGNNSAAVALSAPQTVTATASSSWIWFLVIFGIFLVLLIIGFIFYAFANMGD